MDNAIVTTPSGNNNRAKSRTRYSLTRNCKTRLSFGKSNNINHGKGKICARSNSLRGNSSRHVNNINKININKTLNDNDNSSEGKLLPDSCFGEFTREVYNAICLRLGHTLHIPEDSLQALFNDMQLFPSEEQVAAMIQCARQCSRRNGAQNKYVTYGEFCLFVRELQNQHSKHNRRMQQPKSISECRQNCEVFLGGSCNPTTWRTDTAIPELQKHGISFYNPQVSIWAPELVEREHDAKQSACVLLYVVDSQTRSTGGMIEVAYLVASGRCVVLVVNPYRSGQMIMGEAITQREYMDLVEARTTLLALVKTRGLKVYTSLLEALQCTADILKYSSSNGITAEQQVAFKLRKLREVFDSYGGQSGEMSFFDVIGAYEKLTNQTLKIQDLYKYVSENTTNKNISNMSISFEKFCALMAEFTTDNCSMFQADGRFLDPLFWKCALLKTQHLLKHYLVQPVANALVWASRPFHQQPSLNNNCHVDYNNSCIYDASQIRNSRNRYPRYNVYLGGSRNSGNNWRNDVAIPILKKYGLTYYNPVLSEKNEILDNQKNDNFAYDNGSQMYEEVLEWTMQMDKSNFLLFVINSDTRSLTSMILAAYHIAKGSNMVLCIEHLPEENCIVHNEKLTEQAIKDYNRGRVYLADYATKNKVPVFSNITETMQYVVDKLSTNSSR